MADYNVHIAPSDPMIGDAYYSTLSTASATEGRDITAAGSDENVYFWMHTFSGGLTDDTAMNDGWTTDATHRITIAAYTGHEPTWFDDGTFFGGFYFGPSGNSTIRPVTAVSHLDLVDLEFDRNGDTDEAISTANGGLVGGSITRLIVHDAGGDAFPWNDSGYIGFPIDGLVIVNPPYEAAQGRVCGPARPLRHLRTG